MNAPTPGPIAHRDRSADLRQAYDLAIAGAIGAVVGLYLYVELVPADSTSIWARDALAGGSIGGTIGFFLNAWGPMRDGAWLKLARDSTWGALVGAAGGAVGLVVGEVVLGTLQGGLAGRAVSWAILGLGIGASQGLATRSRQRLAFGLIGGALGGSVGGFLFEAIFEAMRKGMGERYDLGQGIGIVMLGAGLGLMLAFVEQALRRAWVQVLRGRQEGRSYLLAGRTSALGLDERAEVGLFGDPTVARRHAEIVARGGEFALRVIAPPGRTRVNGQAVNGEKPLQDGDRIELGQTLLLFRRR